MTDGTHPDPILVRLTHFVDEHESLRVALEMFQMLALLREARDWLQDPSAYAQGSARSFDERLDALLARLPPAPEVK